MASPAQLKSLPFGRKGCLRGGFLMALVAHSVRHGAMHVRIQDASIIGAMGVMTARATTFGNGVIHMPLFE